MSAITACAVPADALLCRHRVDGAFADCYVTEVDGTVSFPTYVEAFYTSPLFKVERAILTRLASRPSTDRDVRALADGSGASFAAWRVEGRAANELLLADFSGRTRSWLMSVPAPGAQARTRLYFGSAVLPRVDAGTGRRSMGPVFGALLGFHKLYSRALLRAARSRCDRIARDTTPTR